MKIGGVNPLSLSDFPGRVAAVVFTRGCNFRCPFCHNGTLLDAAAPAADAWDEPRLFQLLARRRALLDGVVVSGGEPTLQVDLAPFLQRLRRFDLAVKLDTNGSRPDVLARVIALELVDFIAMDVKAPLPRYGDLAGVPVDGERIRRSIALIAESGLQHEFRTTVVPELLDESDLTQLRRLVPPHSPYRLQPFRAELALDPHLRAAAATPTRRAV